MNKVCPAEILEFIQRLIDYLENDHGEREDYQQNPSSSHVYLDIQKVKLWTEASLTPNAQERSTDRRDQCTASQGHRGCCLRQPRLQRDLVDGIHIDGAVLASTTSGW